MKRKWLLSALAASAFMLFSACGDEPASSAPVTPGGGTPIPASSADIGGGQPVTPVTQSYGILPTTANATVALNWAALWKATYYRTYSQEAALYPNAALDWAVIFGNYVASGLEPARIIWDTQNDSYCVIEESHDSYKKRGCTVSEAIGYSMLISFFLNDFTAFNSLWTYNKGYRDYMESNLMPWKVGTYSYESTLSPSNSSSAADADLDIATALILAYYSTGNQMYLDDAILIATAIWEKEISPKHMIYSGNTATWTKETSAFNLSYFSPIALKLFALVDKAHDWTDVLNTMYTYMQAVQAKGPGLIPDWTDVNGSPIDPKNGSAGSTYWRFFHEAVRVPWRIAWDYYWTQDARAQQVLTGMNNFITAKTGGNPAMLSSEAGMHIYSAVTGMPDSTLKKENLQPHFHGAWCLTGMGGNQAWLDACTADFNTRTMSGFSYFPHILMTMFGELLNGLFVKPATLPL